MLKNSMFLIVSLVLMLGAVSNAMAAPQYARPVGTTTAGMYTVTGAPTLHEAVDEITVSTADYFGFTGGNKPADKTSTAELTLSNTVVDPSTSTGHFIRAHFTCDVCTSAVTLDVVLLEGGVERARTSVQSTTSSLSVSYELSPAETDNITSYSGFSFQVIGTVSSKNDVINVNWLEFEVPAAGPSIPTVSVTDDVILANVTPTTATLGGDLTANGGANVTEIGVVWDTTSPPESAGITVSETAGAPYAAIPFTLAVSGLPAGTQIFNKAYAINSVGTGYGPEKSFYTEPDVAPSGVLFSSVTTNSMTIDWTAGSGDGSIVVIKASGDTLSDPVDGNEHAFNNQFLLGEQLGSGNYVVHRGAGTNINVTGLAAGTTYDVAIYTYAGSGTGASGINYLESPTAASQQTSFEPPTVSTPTATSITDTTAVLGGDITNNGGTNITEIGVVWDTASPPESAGITVSETAGAPYAEIPFTLGVSGLPEATLIYFKALAINSSGTSYTSESTFTTLAAEPVTPPTNIVFSNVGQSSMTITWTAGSGDGSIVVMKLASAAVGPADATDYAADAAFGAGEQTDPGSFVVYKSNSNTVDITGLNPEATYHVAIYSYAGSGVTSNYLQSSPLIGNQITTGQQPHNQAYNITCTTCHNHAGGDGWVPRYANQEVVCKNCHNPAGLAAAKSDVFNHATPSQANDQDCGSCHEIHNNYTINPIESYNEHTGVTQNNIKYLRANVQKYIPGAIEPAVLHTFPDDMAFEDDDGNRLVTPTATMGQPYNGMCQACHTSTGNQTNHTSSGDHLHNTVDFPGDDCNVCHKHGDGFSPSGGGTCLTCHVTAKGARREIISELQRFSHHLNNVNADPDPANWTQGERDAVIADCQVCHDQSTHQNGTVRLYDVDGGPSIVLGDHVDAENDPSEAAKLSTFCLACHDADAASGANPFSDNVAPPIVDGTQWSTAGHNVGGATGPSCFGNGSNGCHGTGHGSDKEKLLAPSVGASTAPDYSEVREGFCFECHDGDGMSSLDILAEFNTATDFQSQSSSGAVINQKHDVLPADQTYSGAVITCKDCHAPHVNNSTDPVSDLNTGLALPTYSPTNSYTGDAPTFTYNQGRATDQNPASPEGGGSVTEPDFIQFCLTCHDGNTPVGVTMTSNMIDIASSWSSSQHGAGQGSTGGSIGKGYLKVPWTTVDDFAAGQDPTNTYAAINCTTCHGAHGTGNIYNLRTSITVAGTIMATGGTEGEFMNIIGTTYTLPEIETARNSGIFAQEDHYWGAWCTFCHTMSAHAGKVETDSCTGGHMHGGTQF